MDSISYFTGRKQTESFKHLSSSPFFFILYTATESIKLLIFPHYLVLHCMFYFCRKTQEGSPAETKDEEQMRLTWLISLHFLLPFLQEMSKTSGEDVNKENTDNQPGESCYVCPVTYYVYIMCTQKHFPELYSL